MTRPIDEVHQDTPAGSDGAQGDRGVDHPVVSTERFPRPVICAWCGNRYRSAIPSEIDRGLQGSHCASDVIQRDGSWLIRCGYGSDEHDMHTYRFVANPPSEPADPVCDECISQRVHAGDIEDIGLEADRRPEDFGPRPYGTWGLVSQIRSLLENRVAMLAVIKAACDDHDAAHHPDENGTPHQCECRTCSAVREYRKHQRWTGEIDDGGEGHPEGCPEVAAQMREAAANLERLAVYWENRRAGVRP